ncbi:hypothetical protein EXM22_04775 [Oceanispirochaeta crateris]|uniref:Uncharacterized protein n=1 Tax=Oceanispirochaeta crateris TaxID=2518645 RepID=A0A5C1QL51_9SPIO|nr:hypothetical protein [Oceanispirochaeta crateris]QEN07334.1 hypothetical protein EXM22_04775 [Oceanispirochaeta crateris]
MSAYIDLSWSLLPNHSLNELISKGEGIYSAEDILNFILDSKYRSILKMLMDNNDEIFLHFIELEKISQTHWKMINSHPEYMQDLISLINNLPWDLDEKTIKIDQKFISTLINQKSKITSYGDDLDSFSENDIKWITEHVCNDYGQTIIMNFNSISAVLVVLDQAVINLYVAQMDR